MWSNSTQSDEEPVNRNRHMNKLLKQTNQVIYRVKKNAHGSEVEKILMVTLLISSIKENGHEAATYTLRNITVNSNRYDACFLS